MVGVGSRSLGSLYEGSSFLGSSPNNIDNSYAPQQAHTPKQKEIKLKGMILSWVEIADRLIFVKTLKRSHDQSLFFSIINQIRAGTKGSFKQSRYELRKSKFTYFAPSTDSSTISSNDGGCIKRYGHERKAWIIQCNIFCH